MPVASIPVIFVTSFIVGFSGAVTPGPLLVYDIREAVRRGFMAGPLVSLGHSILELIVVIGLTMGVARFLGHGVATMVMGLLGGAFLVWMGYGMVRHPSHHVMPDTNDQVKSAHRGRPMAGIVLGGALVSMSNPFWSIWWVTVGLSYILWAMDLGLAGLASFYTGHILADIIWFSFVALAVSSGRRTLTPSIYRRLIFVCGLFLVGLGGYFVFIGLRFPMAVLGT